MDPAVSTLIGTALGGFIGGGSSFLLERTRVRRDREAQERDARLAARRAARLIADELKQGDQRVNAAIEGGHYTWGLMEPLETNAWHEYRADFAASADVRSWDRVADAYAELSFLNAHLAGVLEEYRWMHVPPPSNPLDNWDLDPAAKRYTRRAALALGDALAALRALMDTEL